MLSAACVISILGAAAPAQMRSGVTSVDEATAVEPSDQQPATTDAGSVQELFDTATLNRAQPFLELDSDQFAKFRVAMGRLQALRRRHVTERTRQLAILRRLSRQSVESAPIALLQRLQAFDDLEMKMAVDERLALSEVDRTLSPFQRVRLRVLEDNTERAKIDFLAAAKGGRTGRGI